jgi:hypothetical protein
MCAVALAVGLAPQVVAATVRYVATTGSDSGACSSPAAPCRTLQYAVDHSVSGDEVRVAAGEYTGVLDHAAPAGYTPATVKQIVYIDTTLALRGGFTTANWTTPNPAANVTTLDAQGGGRGIFVAGTLDPARTNPTPVIEGFRLAGGNASGLRGYMDFDAGGGVYVFLAAATVRSCTFLGNNASATTKGAGGGLAAYWAPVTVTSCTFDGNTGSAAGRGSGGGAFVFPGQGATALTGNVFRNNTAGAAAAGGSGGAVYFSQLAATFAGNTVEQNTAASAAGATGWGGGLYSDTCALTMRDNAIRNNRASADGTSGGGGGVYLGDGSLDSTGDQIIGNTATARPTGGSGNGGGFYAISLRVGQTATVTLRNATISANRGSASVSSSSGSQGGGVSLNRVDATLTGCTLENNVGSVGASAQGGGLYALDAAVSFVGGVIRGNSAGVTTGSGGGIYVAAPMQRPSAGLTLIDSLVESNTAGGTQPGQGGGVMVERYSPVLLQGNRIVGNAANGTGGGVALGGDIVPMNPMFTATVPASVIGNLIRGNRSLADGGAGVFAAWGSAGWGGLVIALNRVEGNTASTFGYATGGGIALLWSQFSRVESNQITGNTSGRAGGGIGMMYTDDVVVEANTVRGNLGCQTCDFPSGGGIAIDGDNVSLRRNLVAGNAASGTPNERSSGGGIAGNTGRSLSITNNVIAGNTAPWGAGMSLYGNVVPFPYAPDLTTSGLIAHNSIADNGGGGAAVEVSSTRGPFVPLGAGASAGAAEIVVPAGAGWNVGDTISLISPSTDWITAGWELRSIAAIKPGVRLVLDAPLQSAFGAGSLVSGTRLVMRNNVIAGHPVGIAVLDTDLPVIGVDLFDVATAVQNTETLQGVTSYFLAGLANVVTGDPRFVGPGSGDYHISAGSAATDAGVAAGVAVDFDNQPRPAGAGVDLGADEYGGTCTPVQAVTIGGPATAAAGVPVTLAATTAPADTSAVVDIRWVPEPGAGQGTASATYTFAAAGSPVVTAIARNCGGAVSTSRAVGVGACALACAATVPPSARPGVPVTLAGSATATGCADPVTYHWSFGDAAEPAAGQTAVHAYAGVGRCRWTLTATAGAVACSSSGEIVVAARTVRLRRVLGPAR